MNLGTKIRNIRYKNNISQEEMARLLKINRNYLSRIETNKSLPTSEVLVKLADAFDVSIDSLLDINIDGKDSEKIKLDKIKKINEYCECLNNTELDFIINMLYGMVNHSKID